MTYYGTCIALSSKSVDITSSLSTVTGINAVLPSAVNAMLVSPGDLPWAPEIGGGLGYLLNTNMNEMICEKIVKDCEKSILSDDRIDKVRVTYFLNKDTVRFDVRFMLASGDDGSFAVVKNVSSQDFTIEALS